MYQLQRIQQLSCDIDTAWQFFSSPHNLDRITPPSMRFRLLTELPREEIFTGMLIDYRIQPIWRIPCRWRTLITDVHYQQRFTDLQLRGPYRHWEHMHRFTPNDKGVLMEDEVHYALPCGLIGNAAHVLFVKKRLQAIFDYRYRVLQNLFTSKTMTPCLS